MGALQWSFFILAGDLHFLNRENSLQVTFNCIFLLHQKQDQRKIRLPRSSGPSSIPERFSLLSGKVSLATIGTLPFPSFHSLDGIKINLHWITEAYKLIRLTDFQNFRHCIMPKACFVKGLLVFFKSLNEILFSADVFNIYVRCFWLQEK